jgi:hypothetical protein
MPVALPGLTPLTRPAGTAKPRQFNPYVASKMWISDAFGGKDQKSMIWRESQKEASITARPSMTLNRIRPTGRSSWHDRARWLARRMISYKASRVKESALARTIEDFEWF